jgi:hypothetical protein
MKKIVLSIMLSWLFLIVPSNAAGSADPFFNQLQGEWAGEGTAFGASAAVKQKWEWVLGEKFFRLNLRYEVKAADGRTQLFEGHGYYRSKGNDRYEGQWFDIQGNQYPLSGQVEAGVLITLWGIPGKLEGRSIYRLSDSGKQLESIDSLKQKDGGWKEFSRFTLKR